jgi:NDP-sugar pyrophosphorylase family protein
MKTQCVILAGGLGTRMRLFTDEIPKALIPVNSVPFVDHQLRWLAAHGVETALFCIGHRGRQLRDHVGDGSRFGVRVCYVDEGEHLRGTAGALRLALEEGALEESFLLTYGDSYLPVDFGEFARAFDRSDAAAMMAVFRNRGLWDRSNVIVSDGRVALYDKRRSDAAAAGMEYIDYGLSAMRRSVVEERVPPGVSFDLADLLHDLSIEGRLAAYEVATRFYEVGSPQGLADLERFLVDASERDS